MIKDENVDPELRALAEKMVQGYQYPVDQQFISKDGDIVHQLSTNTMMMKGMQEHKPFALYLIEGLDEVMKKLGLDDG